MTPAELAEAERLSAQADAVAAEYAPEIDPAGVDPAGVDPEPGPTISPEDAEKGYRMLGLAVVNQSCTLFVPAWNVTPEEKGNVTDALVNALLIWFPDGIIPVKYLALLVLVSAVGNIAMARMDSVTGALPPRHVPPPKPATVTPTQIQPTH